MKKFAVPILVGLGLFTTQAHATGPYDGIWTASYLGTFVGYYSVHENNGTLVAISAKGDNTLWEAYAGQRIGNTASLSTIVSGVNASLTVQFLSDSAFVATQLSCVPTLATWQCPFPNGAIIQGSRIW